MINGIHFLFFIDWPNQNLSHRYEHDERIQWR